MQSRIGIGNAKMGRIGYGVIGDRGVMLVGSVALGIYAWFVWKFEGIVYICVLRGELTSKIKR